MDYDVLTARLQVVPAAFAGVELTARLVYGTFEFPVGVGVTAEVSTADPRSFDLSRDLRLYVFGGVDGFSGGARPSTHAAAAQRGR